MVLEAERNEDGTVCTADAVAEHLVGAVDLVAQADLEKVAPDGVALAHLAED